jgi:hypothetical protein
MKIKESVIDFVQLAQEEQHLQFQKIWALEQLIFPTSSIEQLYSCLYDSTAVSIPIVQYFHRGKLVGQNIISILKLEMNGQAIFIISSRAGFLTEYRGRSRSLNSAIRVALNYRMRNPFTPLWFVTTLMQPKIYTLFTSRSVNFFPRAGRKMPKAHADILNLMQSRYSGAEVRGENIIVHPCNMPKITASGCALGALTAAYCAVSSTITAGAMAAHIHFAIAGKKAYERANTVGSFNVAFLDEIYALNEEDLLQYSDFSILPLEG